jgi:hypothetical protein
MMTSPESDRCRAESVHSAKDILRFADDAKRLIGDALGSLCPKFFLASIPREQCLPRVVVVRRAGEVIGIVYAIEQKLAGIRTGMIFGDTRLGPMIASRMEDWEAVWRSAVTHLLTRKTVLGVRLAIPLSEYELYAEERIVNPIGAVASYRDEELSNALLPLASSYEAFLSQLGSHTRRNLRYYRRRFEKHGHAYAEPLTIPEFCAAVFELSGNSPTPAQREIIEFRARLCSTADRPMLAGLRADSGKWLAVLGGWYSHGQPTVYLQMNRDREHPASSLSMVLRGYLIESLIRQGFSSLVFVHGVSEPLKRYSQRIPTIALYLDKPHGFLSPASLLELAARMMPQRHAQHADWIVNPNPQSQISRLRELRKSVSAG